MRSRKGNEDRHFAESGDVRMSRKQGTNVGRVKSYAVILVTVLGICTVFWLYAFSIYKNSGNYSSKQAVAQPTISNNQVPPKERINSNNNNGGFVHKEKPTEKKEGKNDQKEYPKEPLVEYGKEHDEATDDQIYLPEIIKAGKEARTKNSCVHKPGRNYAKNPVNVLGNNPSTEITSKCDVPCVYNMHEFPYADASLGMSGGCGHVSRVTFSMESVVNYPNLKYETIHNGGYSIAATYELDSDVPLPYFSWAEYNFRKEPLPKTAKSMVAMFISNCGASNGRLEYIRELMSYGITVDSFGRCMHNKDTITNGGNYNDVKGETIARYKFTIAMENSNTKDYVTEKLYTPLSWGTVPIHMGLTNIHDYAPEHSVISVHDFPSAKELAEYLKELDRNETKYNEYLAWKHRPYTKAFKALVDISNVHSACRLCIKAADINRQRYGPEKRPADLPTFTAKDLAQNKGSLPLWVRERGKYWPLPVFVKGRTVKELKKVILDTLRPNVKERTGDTEVWAVYNRYARITKDAYITEDNTVAEMRPFTELEAVIVD